MNIRLHIIQDILARMAVLLVALLSSVLTSDAKEFSGYTKEFPLIIVSDWDFQPYEFLNSDGQPAGYNIDVLNLILDRLDIPHKFVMEEWFIAAKKFERHEADLIHGLTYVYRSRPYVQSKKYINYYTVNVARKQGSAPLQSVNHLGKNDTLYLKENDYAALKLKEFQDSLFLSLIHI